MKIVIDNLCKSYGDKDVLSDFSYDFSTPGLYCVSGVSGRGKTTLLRIISSLEAQDSGSVSVSGSLRLMFQENRLLPGISCEENIACALSGKRSERLCEARRLLSLLSLSDCAGLTPSKLSGGMQRRIAFLRAVAPHPDILLLDEPFTGLDSASQAPVTEIISQYARKHIVIMVSHKKDSLSALDITEISL